MKHLKILITLLAFACTALPLHFRVKEPFYSAIMSRHTTLIKCQVKPDAVPHEAMKVMHLNVQIYIINRLCCIVLVLLLFSGVLRLPDMESEKNLHYQTSINVYFKKLNNKI